MTKRTIVLLLLTIFIFSVEAIAASHTPEQIVAQKRLDRIGSSQIGVGVDVSGWNNVHTAVLLHYSLGSSRNLMNMTMATGYRITMPIGIDYPPDIIGHYIPVALGVRCNWYRWERNSTYVSAEAICNINVGNQSVHKTCFSVCAGLGLRLSALDMRVGFTYDVTPSYNQKYIYETIGYDYEALHNTIYERMQLGIRLVYFFTLKL